MNEYKACVNGKYIMTNQIRNILVQGENVPCTITFVIPRIDLPSFCYLMYQRVGDTAPYIISVERVQTDVATELSFQPSTHFCAKAGAVAIQLIACEIDDPQEVADGDEDNIVKLTEIASINVAESMVNPDQPEPLESIFTEYLTQFESLLSQAQEAAGDAQTYAQQAEQAKQDAIDALAGLTQRVGTLEGKVTNLETPVEITNAEIDGIFESEE